MEEAKQTATTAFVEEISERIRAHLNEKNAARERALANSREVIRSSALAIRAIHRNEIDRARELIAKARTGVTEAEDLLATHPDILHAGFVHDAAKEYAEASITLALVRGEPMPPPEELRVSYTAYLNGAGEAAGELRRYLLDRLRHGTPEVIEQSEQILSMMEDIYSVLVTIDYPDAITGGLRRTTDLVRGVLEKTRGDLTLTIIQTNLQRKLAAISPTGETSAALSNLSSLEE